MQHWVLMINLARDLFISVPGVELNSESLGLILNRFDTELGLILKSNLILKLVYTLKSNLILKLVFILKSNLVPKLGFMLKFVYILNIELIFDILECSKPSIFSLKQPGRLAACYMENTPLALYLQGPHDTCKWIVCSLHPERKMMHYGSVVLWTNGIRVGKILYNLLCTRGPLVT